MNKKISLIIIFLVVFSSISIAQDALNTKILLKSIDSLKKYEGKELPGLLAFLFGNKVIELGILMKDGSVEYLTIEIEGSVLKKIYNGKGRPNILIIVSEAILDQILKSENPLSAFLDYYKTGQVGLNGVGFGAKFRLFFFKMFVRLGLSVQANVETKETAVEFKCPLSCPTEINTDFGGAITCKVKEELQDKKGAACEGSFENSPGEFKQCGCKAVKVTSEPCPSECTLSNGKLCVLRGTIGAKNIGKSNVACVGQTKWREGKPNILPCLCN